MTESIKIRVRKGGDKIHYEKIVVYFESSLWKRAD